MASFMKQILEAPQRCEWLLEGFCLPGWHEVVVVVELDEGLDPRPPLHLLLAHILGDLAGVAVDASDQGVAVRSVRAPVVVVLQQKLKPLTCLIPQATTVSRTVKPC